jgi:hypothetical protein
MTTIPANDAVIRGGFTGIQDAAKASNASLWTIYQHVTAAAKGEPLQDTFVSVLERHKTAAKETGILGRIYESVLLYAKSKVEYIMGAINEVLAPIKNIQAEIDKRIGTAFERVLGEEGAALAEKAVANAARHV